MNAEFTALCSPAETKTGGGVGLESVIHSHAHCQMWTPSTCTCTVCSCMISAQLYTHMSAVKWPLIAKLPITLSYSTPFCFWLYRVSLYITAQGLHVYHKSCTSESCLFISYVCVCSEQWVKRHCSIQNLHNLPATHYSKDWYAPILQMQYMISSCFMLPKLDSCCVWGATPQVLFLSSMWGCCVGSRVTYLHSCSSLPLSLKKFILDRSTMPYHKMI